MTAYAYAPQTWERDPVITPGAHGRADVPSGKRGRWGRYNDPASLVWVDTIDGRTVSLTRNQANVYGAVKGIAGTGTRITMRSLGDVLRIAPSTVYRALVRLAAMGLIAYQSNRGRLGGAVFLLRANRDGLDWFRDEAKATLKRWWKASEDRISRLRLNVASLYPTTTVRLSEYSYTDIVRERNIYGPWTAEDLREAGL